MLIINAIIYAAAMRVYILLINEHYRCQFFYSYLWPLILLYMYVHSDSQDINEHI